MAQTKVQTVRLRRPPKRSAERKEKEKKKKKGGDEAQPKRKKGKRKKGKKKGMGPSVQERGRRRAVQRHGYSSEVAFRSHTLGGGRLKTPSVRLVASVRETRAGVTGRGGGRSKVNATLGLG